MIGVIRREWDAWCRQAAASLRAEGDDWRATLVSLAFFVVLAFVGRYTGPTDQPWMPDPWPALGVAVAACVFHIGTTLCTKPNAVSDRTLTLLLLGLLFAVQLATLEFANAAHGVFLYAVLVMYLFVASVQAYRSRCSFRRPFALIPWAAALAVACSHASTDEHLLLFGNIALWLAPGLLVVGQFASRADAAREREAALRAENAALALELERNQVGRLEEFLEEIAGRTHDIGGPALALEMALERAAKSRTNEACEACTSAREVLEQAKKHADDLRTRVRRAKDEVRSVSLPPFEPVDVREVARGVVEGLRLRFADVQIEVADEPASVDVRGGRLALARVLENLAGNGAEAARESAAPKLQIGWKHVDASTEVSIEDSGPGFDADAAMHARGTGVGLLSARRIIATSNGTLEIDRSESFGGARCIVRLTDARARPRT